MASDTTIEHWREIPDFGHLYAVSDQGRVRNCFTGRIFKTRPKEDGYVSVNLKWRCYYVHQLVLTAFVGPCPSGSETAHADGNRSNNRLDNLRWATPKENADDRRRHGTHPRGEMNARAIINEAQVHEIDRLRNSGTSFAEIAKRMGYRSPSSVKNVYYRKAWKHVQRIAA